jgi:hypothetical protein
MKKLLTAALLGLLVFAAGAQMAAAAPAGTLQGRVIHWDGTPVAGATVAALLGPLETDKELTHTTTAADGSWSLSVPAGAPYWVHVRTFGTWWGYSYEPPFTLADGEVVSQIYFALGPRSVKDVVLPAPVSNATPVPPTVTLPTATPAPAATATPVSQVLPAIGGNEGGQTPGKGTPAAPQTLPSTGATSGLSLLWLLLAGATLLTGAGLGVRKLAMRQLPVRH